MSFHDRVMSYTKLDSIIYLSLLILQWYSNYLEISLGPSQYL